MTNWKDFFEKYLILTGYYRLNKPKSTGETVIDTFVSTDENDNTFIRIGYLSYGELIFCDILNPDTFGYNKYQEQEYFYRFDFTPGESYGPPGLKYNETNADSIKSKLKNGLKGKEIQYYSNDKLIKSIIYKNFNDTTDENWGITIRFQKDTLFQRIRNMLFGHTTKYTIKEIDLNKIFKGLDIND